LKEQDLQRVDIIESAVVASIVEAEKPFVTELLFEGITPELHSRAEESNEPDISRCDVPE
jgi:hypothetical protein